MNDAAVNDTVVSEATVNDTVVSDAAVGGALSIEQWAASNERQQGCGAAALLEL